MINPKIFKAYDIRGIYPSEINEEAAYGIGRVFASFIGSQAGEGRPLVVLSRDNRNSSPSLYNEVKRGLLEGGTDVLGIGLSSTPMFYFSVAHYGANGGINITASHNPKQYNGFKLVRGEAVPISGDTGIEAIKEAVLSGYNQSVATPGFYSEKDPLDDYIAANNGGEKFPFRVIVDTGNSASGVVVSKMFSGVDLIHLNSNLDGNFPAHEPDPLKEENTLELRKEVVARKAALGVSFDGDGDRVFFIDETGKTISSDLILALVSSIILRSNKGAKILYDVRCSNVVRETIEALGGQAVMSRVGHSFIKEVMRREDIIFGGEYSGHYYAKYKEGYYFENPFLVLFSLLKEMMEKQKPLSALIAPFRKYFHSGELNFSVADKEGAIGRVEAAYASGRISRLDGLRIDFDDWWFSLRPSNTEPLLRLIVEAKTAEMMEKKAGEIKELIV